MDPLVDLGEQGVPKQMAQIPSSVSLNGYSDGNQNTAGVWRFRQP